jgi:hypothetical protein
MPTSFLRSGPSGPLIELVEIKGFDKLNHWTS